MFSKSSHSQIKNIFPNVYFVTGSTQYLDKKGEQQQHSRNMIIIREKGKLSLINSVRLSEDGFKELEQLGQVENVIRIGAFHDLDDPFYITRYKAKLWALPGMQHKENCKTDIELSIDGPKPFSDCSLFIFKKAKAPEAIIHLNRENGILISCDSIKNWLKADEFFSEKTASLYENIGFFGEAKVSKIWRDHCQVQLDDFMELNQFSFKHLLSAHGEPLLNLDKERFFANIENQYKQFSKL